MKNEVIAKDESIREIIPIEIYNYEQAVRRTVRVLDSGENVVSSWKDSIADEKIHQLLQEQSSAPANVILRDERIVQFDKSPDKVWENIWQIGGEKGWYYGNILWQIRGMMDKMVGGVGLRRGRRSANDLKPGDALDFWRVLVAQPDQKHLLLLAEMKVPGKAWLEFKIKEKNQKHELVQTAMFLPKGLIGRLYWYALLPVHEIIFSRMARNIVNK